MALVEKIVKTDDLTGGPAHHTREFTYKGKTYVLDLGNLSAGNFDRAMERIAKIMAPYVEAGTEVTSQRAVKRTAGAVSEAAKVRTWARENGFEVGTRGRLRPEIFEAYKAANDG